MSRQSARDSSLRTISASIGLPRCCDKILQNTSCFLTIDVEMMHLKEATETLKLLAHIVAAM